MPSPLLTLRRLSLIASSALLLAHAPARAELTIEFSVAGASRIPVAIADFGGDAGFSRAITTVIRSDLERSGLFRLVDTSGVAMNRGDRAGLWRLEEPRRRRAGRRQCRRSGQRRTPGSALPALRRQQAERAGRRRFRDFGGDVALATASPTSSTRS